MTLPPRALLDLNRQEYSKAERIEAFANPAHVDSGLNDEENDLLNHVPVAKGELLLLGLGGGREAIALAKKGFSVTGIDFIPGMVKQSEANARRHGVAITALVQDVNGLDFPEQHFNVVWAGFGQYSTVPTRKRRRALVRKTSALLKPGGFFVCHFHLGKPRRHSLCARLARYAVAILCAGNFWYEQGDVLWGNREFLHAFLSLAEVKDEVEPCGFRLIHEHAQPGDERGGVVFEKISS